MQRAAGSGQRTAATRIAGSGACLLEKVAPYFHTRVQEPVAASYEAQTTEPVEIFHRSDLCLENQFQLFGLGVDQKMALYALLMVQQRPTAAVGRQAGAAVKLRWTTAAACPAHALLRWMTMLSRLVGLSATKRVLDFVDQHLAPVFQVHELEG